MSETIFGGTFASANVAKALEAHAAKLVRVALTNAKATVPIADAATMTEIDFAGSALSVSAQSLLMAQPIFSLSAGQAAMSLGCALGAMFPNGISREDVSVILQAFAYGLGRGSSIAPGEPSGPDGMQ